jgi:hypothetical protein
MLRGNSTAPARTSLWPPDKMSTNTAIETVQPGKVNHRMQERIFMISPLKPRIYRPQKFYAPQMTPYEPNQFTNHRTPAALQLPPPSTDYAS